MNILVSGIASDIGYNVAKILKSNQISNYIFGIDVIHKIYSKNIFNNVSLSPKASDSNYINWLTDFIKKNQIDIFIPTSEAEISVLSRINDKELFKNKLLINNNFLISIFLDKHKSLNFLKKYNIKVPINGLVGETYPKKYPVIIKPRFGRGSRNIKIINSNIELNDFDENYVWQELLEPSNNEYTCPVYISKNKEIRILLMKRKLHNGVTNNGIVVNDKDIYEYVHNIAKLIKFNSVINIQLIKTEKGPLVFEINPRLSSTIMFRHKMGFTDLKWWIDDLLYNKIESYFPPKDGVEFYIKDKQYIIKNNND